MLKYMYDAPTKEKALEAAEEIMDFLEECYPEAMELLDNAKTTSWLSTISRRIAGRRWDHEHDGADQ